MDLSNTLGFLSDPFFIATHRCVSQKKASHKYNTNCIGSPNWVQEDEAAVEKIGWIIIIINVNMPSLGDLICRLCAVWVVSVSALSGDISLFLAVSRACACVVC